MSDQLLTEIRDLLREMVGTTPQRQGGVTEEKLKEVVRESERRSNRLFVESCIKGRDDMADCPTPTLDALKADGAPTKPVRLLVEALPGEYINFSVGHNGLLVGNGRGNVRELPQPTVAELGKIAYTAYWDPAGGVGSYYKAVGSAVLRALGLEVKE